MIGKEATVVQEKLSPLELFLAAFALSSLGGLTALLRSQKVISARSLLSATLYSGLMGLVIALISYNYMGISNPYFLLGVCGLAGIGGATVLDFVVQMLKNGGIEIRVAPKPDPGDEAIQEGEEADHER